MNSRPDQPDLPDDERLRRLLDETLADVEPRDQLDAIRNRTKVTPMSSSSSPKRPWVWGALGAAAATAAVIGGFALVNGQEQSADPDPADLPSATSSPTSSAPSPEPTEATETPVEDFTVAVYYLGDTPQGPRLFREFRKAAGVTSLAAALDAATAQTPLDPDYRTPWPAGIVAATAFDEVIDITLADASVRERPAGMSRAEAEIAVEQLIYTAQAAVQERAPVQFRLAGNPIDQVYGVPTSEPLAQGKPLEVLSLVNITAPEEGATVSGTLDASGVANSFEANVPWQILQGDRVALSGFAMADGAFEDKLFPWQVSIDLSDLPPGTYTFRATTDDPSDGEGPGPFVDTKTITVQ